MAFYYFATVDDMAEIFADIEGEAPVRIIYEHNKTSTEKACYTSIAEIPGFRDGSASVRHRPDILLFPFGCEPVLTEVEVPTRTLMCVYRSDNPDAVDISQPSLVYVESFPRPEMRAGEVDYFAVSEFTGDMGPTDASKALANRVRKAIRRRSVLLYREGTKRVYIARQALDMARKGEIDLIWSYRCWSAAESAQDAEFLNGLRLPKSAMKKVAVQRCTDNLATIRPFRVRRAEFSEPADPDILFVAAEDDLKPVFETASCFDDLHYSRLGQSRFRSICQNANDLPGLGASPLMREIEAGIIAWRGEAGDYRRVHVPHALADYRIGLLPDGYTAPSLIVFPGGALLRGPGLQAKRLFCGYARIVHGSGQNHFDRFQEAVLSRHVDAVQVPGLPEVISVLPAAKALIDAGIELDTSLLSHHVLHHRLSARLDNVVLFPGRPGTGSG